MEGAFFGNLFYLYYHIIIENNEITFYKSVD